MSDLNEKPATANSEHLMQIPYEDGSIVLEMVEDEDGLAALEADWNGLFADSNQSNRHFQSFNWNRTWSELFVNKQAGDAVKLAVVTARRDGRLILICPLAEHHRAGLVHLCWTGSPVSQYGDVLKSDDAAVPVALKAALDFAAETTGADLIDLRKVRADAAVRPVLKETGAWVAAQSEAPYMDLASADDPEDYAQRYSAQSRKQRRRRRRRLAERGAVWFECLEPGPEAADHAVRAIQHKRSLLRQRNTPSLALNDIRFQQFFEKVATEADSSVSCLVSELHCGSEVVASEIGLLCDDSYCAHVGVFDEAHARCSPGILQIEDMVAECYERGVRRYDLLAPSDAYKLSLADGTVKVTDYVVPRSLRGMIYASTVLKLARPALKRGKDIAPRVAGSLMNRLMARFAPAS